MKLSKGTELSNFLRKRVKRAIAEESINASEWTEFYLVTLLEIYKIADNLFDETQGKREVKPLALTLLEAVNQESTAEKIISLRGLGDNSLYMAGVFHRTLITEKTHLT